MYIYTYIYIRIHMYICHGFLKHWQRSNLCCRLQMTAEQSKQTEMHDHSQHLYLGSEAAPYFSLHLLADFRLGSMGATPKSTSPSQRNLQSLQICLQMFPDNAWCRNNLLSKWNTQEESINVLAPTALLGASAMLGDAILVQGSGSAQGNPGNAFAVPKTKILWILLSFFFV